MNTNELNFTDKSFDIFKKEYSEADKNKKESFMFQGCEIVTLYAKYVIEHLSPKFTKK